MFSATYAPLCSEAPAISYSTARISGSWRRSAMRGVCPQRWAKWGRMRGGEGSAVMEVRGRVAYTAGASLRRHRQQQLSPPPPVRQQLARGHTDEPHLVAVFVRRAQIVDLREPRHDAQCVLCGHVLADKLGDSDLARVVQASRFDPGPSPSPPPSRSRPHVHTYPCSTTCSQPPSSPGPPPRQTPSSALRIHPPASQTQSRGCPATAPPPRSPPGRRRTPCSPDRSPSPR